MQSLEFSIQNKEDLVKLLKNLKNDQHYISGLSDFVCMFRAAAK